MASFKKFAGKRGVSWRVRYTTPDGKHRHETYRTQREARDRLHAIEDAKRRGAFVDRHNAARPFAAIAAEWLDSNATKRASSRDRDEGIIRSHLDPALGSRAVGGINPADVQRLVHELSATLAPSSVRRSYSVLRAIMNYAVAADVIVRSPCRGIKLPAEQRQRRHVVTAQELELLADAMGAYGPMAYIGAVLGLRWGEIAGLKVGRLDFLARTLTVEEQLARGHKGRPELGAPKSNAGRRRLAVPAPLMELLAAHLEERGLTGVNVDELVFVAPKGGPLRYSNWLRRVWIPAIEAVELDSLTFHDLRRASATAMVATGVDLKTAQARFGHSTPTLMLAIYAQATEAADRAAAEVLGEHWIASRDIRATEASKRTETPGA